MIGVMLVSSSPTVLEFYNKALSKSENIQKKKVSRASRFGWASGDVVVLKK